MNNSNETLEIKKKYKKSVFIGILYYLIVLVFFSMGFIYTFLKYGCNIKERVYWYSSVLIDFTYESSKWADLKNIFSGYYVFTILQLIFTFLFMIYLPVAIKEVKKKIFNNNSLYIIDDNLVGTYSKFLKMVEFNYKIEEIKFCKLKKVKLKFLYGKKRLELYTSSKKISIYFLEEFENTKEIIDILAERNNVIYDESISKNRFIKNIKSLFTKLNNSINDFLTGIVNRVENKQRKSLEIKLDELDRLKENKKINDSEYAILREKILTNRKG